MVRQSREHRFASLLPVAAVDTASQLHLQVGKSQFFDPASDLHEEVGKRALDGEPPTLSRQRLRCDLGDDILGAHGVLQVDEQ